jgi:hypothetical protein
MEGLAEIITDFFNSIDPEQVIGRTEIPQCSSLLPCLDVLSFGWARQHANTIQNIQVWPKDFSASLRQVEGAVDRRRRGGRKPDGRHKAARIHQAAWRRGGRVAAGCARAAGVDARDRIS